MVRIIHYCRLWTEGIMYHLTAGKGVLEQGVEPVCVHWSRCWLAKSGWPKAGWPEVAGGAAHPLSLIHLISSYLCHSNIKRRCATQVLVDQLRQKCLDEPRSEDRPRGYSALTQDHKTEWQQEVGGAAGFSAFCAFCAFVLLCMPCSVRHLLCALVCLLSLLKLLSSHSGPQHRVAAGGVPELPACCFYGMLLLWMRLCVQATASLLPLLQLVGCYKAL